MICRSCNEQIKDRDPRAKLCFPCVDKQTVKSGARYAHNIVGRAIKQGVLKPANQHICVDCSKPAFCYDHRDYNKPLDVVPVCRKCNHRRGSATPKTKTEVTK